VTREHTIDRPYLVVVKSPEPPHHWMNRFESRAQAERYADGVVVNGATKGVTVRAEVVGPTSRYPDWWREDK
jgi:hypothetical protein